MKPVEQAHGFTLLELLVAIAIFSFMSAAVFTGVRQIVIERELVQAHTEDLIELQRAVRYLQTDFTQFHPRRVRDELGRDYTPALSNDPSEEFSVRLSRDGWRNPAEKPRGTLQRVHYKLEDGELIREYWPVMDPLLGAESNQLVLLQDVDEIEIAFLDENREWQSNWPPADAPDGWQTPVPLAIRYRITLESFGDIERLVEIP